jgi:Na+-transporting NADH:ubiquinone oxidoreductase subunit NqrB
MLLLGVILFQYFAGGKIIDMPTKTALPDLERLSIVTAIIMLAFALTQLISYPAQNISFSVFGILIDFVLDFNIPGDCFFCPFSGSRHGLVDSIAPRNATIR